MKRLLMLLGVVFVTAGLLTGCQSSHGSHHGHHHGQGAHSSGNGHSHAQHSKPMVVQQSGDSGAETEK